MGIDVQVQGLTKMLIKLDGDFLYGPEMKWAMNQLGWMAEGAVRRYAPRGRTGKCAGYASHRLETETRLWKVWYGSTALGRPSKRDSGGFRYPYALNASAKFHHQGWLKKAARRARFLGKNLLMDAAREIEAKWRAG